jgi:hypothetical protein
LLIIDSKFQDLQTIEINLYVYNKGIRLDTSSIKWDSSDIKYINRLSRRVEQSHTSAAPNSLYGGYAAPSLPRFQLSYMETVECLAGAILLSVYRACTRSSAGHKRGASTGIRPGLLHNA